MFRSHPNHCIHGQIPLSLDTMSKLKVPIPSIVVDSYNDMYYDNPQHSPETTTTSMGSTTSSEEGDANIPIKLSINELHDMVTKMMMQRYNINPNEKNPR